MNYWTKKSIMFANQFNYLDELFKVYPMSLNLKREINKALWFDIESSFNSKNNKLLIEYLLKSEIFPIKDSYVAYMKYDRSSIEKNPETVNRISGSLYELGLDKIYENCTLPKETNRQIGPMFKQWIEKNIIGAKLVKNFEVFINSKENSILNLSDQKLKDFANKFLGYESNKGLDFIAKFNQKYIIGETKFITAYGGHQNAQFKDAESIFNQTFLKKTVNNEVIPIAIVDGVIFIKSKGKLFNEISNSKNIYISSLFLREFLYTL